MTRLPNAAALRSVAEDCLAKAPRRTPQPADHAALMHELEVHQVELEMQVEELTAMEGELEAVKQKYLDLYDLAPVGYLVLGPRGIVEVNRVAARLLGLPQRELVGRSLGRFVTAADEQRLKRHVLQVLGSDEHVSCELTLTNEAGERRDVRLESQRSSAATGRWRTALVDVTEEKRLARQVLGSEPGATSARSLAHDLRHLLMTMAASAELALGRLGPDSAAEEPLLALKHAALYGGSIVSRLVGRGASQLGVPQVSDLNAIVMRAEPLLAQMAGENVRVRLELRASAARVLIAPAEVLQILLNLVSNARDACESGGEIVVLTAEVEHLPSDYRGRVGQAGLVLLSVTDNGSGMSADVQARAFDPRFTTKGPERGTGLGLPNVHDIVKNAGGDVHLVSRAGEGTSVSVVLPRSELVPAAQPNASEVRGPRRSHTPSGIRVRRLAQGASTRVLLVVEDDAATRAAYQELLGNDELHVLGAGTGAEALALFREHAESVCAVLCDFQLPDIYGAELAHQLRELRNGLPILFVSGRTLDDAGVAEMLDEHTRLLTKPVEVAQLIDVLGRLIDAD